MQKLPNYVILLFQLFTAERQSDFFHFTICALANERKGRDFTPDFSSTWTILTGNFCVSGLLSKEHPEGCVVNVGIKRGVGRSIFFGNIILLLGVRFGF